MKLNIYKQEEQESIKRKKRSYNVVKVGSTSNLCEVNLNFDFWCVKSSVYLT